MADHDILDSDANLPVSNHASKPLKPFVLQTGLSNLFDLSRQSAVRRALPMLGGTSALAVAALAWWSLQSPSLRPLYEGLSEADKAAVADALQSSGITYKLDRDTGGIVVNEDDVHKARMLLASQGLPKAAPGGDAMIAALPMGSSRAVEGETLRGAREADLARTIEAIDTVKTARVHLAMPEPSVFVRDAATPAASVMLTLQNGRTLSEAQVRAIRHLVAASVPSLSPEQVSVVDQSGALLSQSDANGDDAAFQLQLQMESRYRQALSALLGPMLGAGNFAVEIHVDVDQSESQSTRESYPKDDRALRQEEGNKTSNTATSPAAVGIPGALSNQPPPASQLSNQSRNTSVDSGNPNENQSAETYTRSFDVGREISVTHQPVGKVRRLTVAVALRDVKGAKPRSPAELGSLEALIKGAVGFDVARGDVVALSARAFAEPDVVTEHIWDSPWFMVAIRQLGALIVALLTLFFLGRPMLKALRNRASNESPAVDNVLEQPKNQSQLPTERQITLDMIEAAPSYADRATLVRDFVKQDPARATLVVRQLMQEGANG
jgi:flagellar M-ring protein FliF